MIQKIIGATVGTPLSPKLITPDLSGYYTKAEVDALIPDYGVPDVIFETTLEEAVSEVVIPLTHSIRSFCITVKPQADFTEPFYVYVYAGDCKNIENGNTGLLEIVGQILVTKTNSSYINRAIARAFVIDGFVFSYWGAAPTEYIASSYAYLNKPIICRNSKGFTEIAIRSLVAGKKIPSGATIKVIGV